MTVGGRNYIGMFSNYWYHNSSLHITNLSIISNLLSLIFLLSLVIKYSSFTHHKLQLISFLTIHHAWQLVRTISISHTPYPKKFIVFIHHI